MKTAGLLIKYTGRHGSVLITEKVLGASFIIVHTGPTFCGLERAEEILIYGIYVSYHINRAGTNNLITCFQH